MTEQTFNPSNPFEEIDFGFEIVSAPESETLSPPVTMPSTEDLSKVVGASVATALTNVQTRLGEISNKITTPPPDLVRKPDLTRLEEKLDKVLTLQIQEISGALKDTEGNIRAVIDEVEERKTEVIQKYHEKMQEIEKLVLPLFYNLMKNPDKEYIRWPNRTDTLNKQIAKVTSITRAQLDF